LVHGPRQVPGCGHDRTSGAKDGLQARTSFAGKPDKRVVPGPNRAANSQQSTSKKTVKAELSESEHDNNDAAKITVEGLRELARQNRVSFSRTDNRAKMIAKVGTWKKQPLLVSNCSG
jgi:hypothetical protein